MKSLFCSIESPIWDTFYTPRGFIKSSLIRCTDLDRDILTDYPIGTNDYTGEPSVDPVTS